MQINKVFDSFPVLETERFILREFVLDDADDVYNYMSDREVLEFYDVEPYTNIDQAKEELKFEIESFKNKRRLRWGIARKEDNKIIGNCGYHSIIKPYFRTEVGYILDKKYWRQGVMTEVLNTVIPYGFENMELNRIEVQLYPENTASVKLTEKLGFEKEGILKEYEFITNKFHDVAVYALLKRNYY
jgi:ribosomal-protein-alanine N-acetyltransferase